MITNTFDMTIFIFLPHRGSFVLVKTKFRVLNEKVITRFQNIDKSYLGKMSGRVYVCVGA